MKILVGHEVCKKRTILVDWFDWLMAWSMCGWEDWMVATLFNRLVGWLVGVVSETVDELVVG